ncbi:MAG: cysteine synthase family protein [Candidatus Sulfotelmatobacter sp.]
MARTSINPEADSPAQSAPEPSTPPPGESLIHRIGNTPLLRFDRIAAHLPGVSLLGKAEWHNPGGSVKDRAAARIVAEGRRSGRFSAGKILLDATSGNTGIAYAMLGAAERFPVTLCMPTNVSTERKKILSAYGASIVYTDPGEGSDGAIRKARQLAAERPDLYFYADQYSNDANWQAHYYGTANEIWQQTEGRITHFVAMLGTSGTFMGTTRRLKELNPTIRCISLQPDSAFHGIEGAKHMASAIVPKIYDSELADENLEIATEDAYAMARRMARECGVLLGISAAAGIVGSLKIAERLQPGKDREATIVTVLCDSGDKYLSERFWTEDNSPQRHRDTENTTSS